MRATKGRLSAKIQRHDSWSTIRPPASGPINDAIAPHAVQAPIAAARSFAGKAATMIASELGTSSAPAAPCRPRAAISVSVVGASAQATEKSAERRRAEREHPPLAVDVAQRPSDQDQRAERQKVRVRHPLLRLQAAAEVTLDRRQRHVDDRPVDRRDPGTEDCRDERGLLSAGHRCLLSHRHYFGQRLVVIWRSSAGARTDARVIGCAAACTSAPDATMVPIQTPITTASC